MKKVFFIFIGSMLMMGGCQNTMPAARGTLTQEVSQQQISQESTVSLQIQPPSQSPPPAPVPTPSPRPVGASGIRGTATIGPTCPVQRIPPDPTCADKPYAALLNFSTQSGTLVKQVQAKGDGSFEAALPAGVYVITQAEGKIYPRLSPQTVTVKQDQYTSIHLSFDSGIR